MVYRVYWLTIGISVQSKPCPQTPNWQVLPGFLDRCLHLGILQGDIDVALKLGCKKESNEKYTLIVHIGKYT
jgi:hypothetical protein